MGEPVPRWPCRQTSAEGFPQGRWCQLALPRNNHDSKNLRSCTFQQSHFGHGWLEPWSILWKTAPRYLLYLKIGFYWLKFPWAHLTQYQVYYSYYNSSKWRKIWPTTMLVEWRKKRFIWILTGSRALNSFRTTNAKHPTWFKVMTVMFHKRNCGSYSFWVEVGFLVCFCRWPIVRERERSRSISIWFGVNTFYLVGVSLIQYYVFFLFDFQATPLELLWIWSHRIPLYVSYTRNKTKIRRKCLSGECVKIIQVRSLWVMHQTQQLCNELQCCTNFLKGVLYSLCCCFESVGSFCVVVSSDPLVCQDSPKKQIGGKLGTRDWFLDAENSFKRIS